MPEKIPINELMADLLEMCDMGQQLPPYVGKYKRLLDEIADRSLGYYFWQKNEAEAREFTRNMTTAAIWRDLQIKIADAPNPIHMTLTIVGLMPIIRERIAFKHELGRRLHYE